MDPGLSLRKRLREPIPKEFLSTRAGPGGSKLTYLESHRAIELANDIFGPDGWSCSVVSSEVDYCAEDAPGRWSCGISALIRVSMTNGSSHEDVGYGIAEGMKSRGMALEKAKKEAISDGRKRALRLFGNGLGNCVCELLSLSFVLID